MVYPYSGIYLANIKKKKSKTLYKIGNNFQGVFLREKKNKGIIKCIAYLPFVYK